MPEEQRGILYGAFRMAEVLLFHIDNPVRFPGSPERFPPPAPLPTGPRPDLSRVSLVEVPEPDPCDDEEAA